MPAIIAMLYEQSRNIEQYIRPSGTGVHCDHTVQVSAHLSLWLDSAMFWAL